MGDRCMCEEEVYEQAEGEEEDEMETEDNKEEEEDEARERNDGEEEATTWELDQRNGAIRRMRRRMIQVL